MSINFSANQYENAFKTLKHWEVPKGFGVYPPCHDGFTQIIASDRGHLTSHVPRSRASPWGTFVGTWDMPTKIPGNSITNTTARAEMSIQKMERMKTEGDVILSGHLKRCKIPPPQRVRDLDASQDVQGDLVAKAASPKFATGRLSGAGEPMVEDFHNRPGAQNPIPDSKYSPKSVDWPRPSRLEKPMTPQRMTPPPLGTPPSRTGSRTGKPLSPVVFPLADGVNRQSHACHCMPESPGMELEYQHLQANSSPQPEPVNWPMPHE